MLEPVEELLARREDGVVGHRHADDATHGGPRELRDAALDREVLEPPPSGLRHREETERLAGRRRVDDDDVVVAGVVVLGDPKEVRELVHPRQGGHLLRADLVEAGHWNTLAMYFWIVPQYRWTSWKTSES